MLATGCPAPAGPAELVLEEKVRAGASTGASVRSLMPNTEEPVPLCHQGHGARGREGGLQGGLLLFFLFLFMAALEA